MPPELDAYVARRTAGFVGRRWLLDALASWLNDPLVSRCFALVGEPGSGKTAVAGRLWELSGGAGRPGPDFERGFLSAAFFVRSGTEWVSPYAFVRSLALQLQRFAPYAQALTEVDTGRGDIRIEGRASAHTAAGPVVGVYVEDLHISELIPVEDAFRRLVAQPLHALTAAEPETRIVILVDALDEALGYSGPKSIVSLLAGMDALPDAVRFVVTTRPDRRILRALPSDRVQRSLSAPEEAANTDADLQAFVEEHLLGNAAITRLFVADLDPRRFTELVIEKSAGNFQYLRHLATMLERSPGAIDEGSLDVLPDGLDRLYVADLERLLEGRSDAWPERFRPFLGVLSIAKEPLAAPQLARMVGVADQDIGLIVRDVEQFLDASYSAKRAAWALYHQSFAEFLCDQRRAEEYWCDPAAHNARVVEAYKAGAATWREADWDSIDDYALGHLAEHVRDAGGKGSTAERLDALICEPMLRTIVARHGSYEIFARTVMLAAEVADEEAHMASRLPILIRQSVLAATIRGIVRNVPPSALAALAALGQAPRAIGYASLIDDPLGRVQAFLAIATHVSDREQAAGLIERTIDLLGFVADPQAAASGFAQIAAAAAHAGHETLARRAAEAAVEPALAIRGDYLNSMPARYFAMESLAVTVDSLVAAGYEDVALDIAAEGLGSGFFGDLLSVLQQRVSARGLERLVGLARHAAESNPGSAALESILCLVLAAAGDIESARESARRFEEAIAEPDRQHNDALSEHLDVAGLYAEAMCPSKAVGTLRSHVDEARAHHVKQFAAVGATLQAQGAVDEATTAFNLAFDVLQRERYAPGVVDGLGDIAQALAACGRYAEARAAAENALELARRFDEPVSGSSALQTAAGALAAAGLREAALEVAGDIPFAIGRDSVLLNLVREFARRGEVDSAIRAADAILRSGDRASAFGAVFQRLADTGELERALEMTERIPLPAARAAGVAALAERAADAGDVARATQLADRSIAQSEAVVGDESKVRAMVAAVAALEVHGRCDNALRLGEVARSVATKVVDQEARARALGQAAGVLERLGSPVALQAAVEAREAEDVVRRLKQTTGVMHYWFETVRDHAEAGRIDQALSLADGLQDEQRARGYAAVAEVLAGQNDARAPELAARAWDHALSLPIAWRPDAILDALHASLALPARDPVPLVNDALATLNQVAVLPQRSAMANRLLAILTGAQLWEPAQLLAVDALRLGRLSGRDAVFAAIEAVAPLLAARDGGATLGHVWETLLEVDSWWDPARHSAGVVRAPGAA